MLSFSQISNEASALSKCNTKMGCGGIKPADFPDETESKRTVTRDEMIKTISILERQIDAAFKDVKTK